MFEFVRNNRRLMMFLLVLIILPLFALSGIEGYARFTDAADVLAKVEGQKITQPIFEQAQRQQLEKLNQLSGGRIDAALLDTPEVRHELLEQMIRERVVERALQKNNLVVTDHRLRELIANESSLQTNGKFDPEKYKTYAAAQGMTTAQLEQQLRYQLTQQQYNNVLQTSYALPKTVADRVIQIGTQQREVQLLLIKPTDFTAQIKIDDAAIQKYFDANTKNFQTTERVAIEYVVLNQEVLAKQVVVKDDEVQTYYQQNQKKYGTLEERRASHILIKSEGDKAKARQQAGGLLAQVRKTPADFAKLAKQFSQDPGSAQNGGDLGFFGPGMMVKPFEEATYKLKENEISDLVESEFGFHIIRLTAIKPAQVKPLTEVRAEIEAEFRKQALSKKYAEAASDFTNLVYEQPDSLKPAADKYGLSIQTARDVQRQVGTNPLFNQKLLNALFNDDAIKNKRNTEAVEVAPNTLVAARVTEYQPARARPLNEVKEEIRLVLTTQAAQQKALQVGQEKLTSLQKAADGGVKEVGFSPAQLVSRVNLQNLDEKSARAIFRADTSKLPQVLGIDLGTQGYAIYRINKVVEQDLTQLPAEQLKAQQSQIGQRIAASEQNAGYEVLKARSKVKVLREPLAAKKEGDK